VSGGPITNFGGNLRFTPRHLYTPTTEAEVLAILDRHAQGRIRVVGALHSWSPAVVCNDALIDLKHFDRVDIQRDADGTVWATVGGGCRIKHLLRRLHALADVTMPTLGLITEQTIAGAIATATHGSGKHSLSHYVQELRVAAYDATTGKARNYTWNDGAELRAARCALGCMGVILSVKFRCVPLYDMAETIVPCATLDEVLSGESAFPLQQFYLVPYLWSYFVQRRATTPEYRLRQSLTAKLYRAWWFLFIDVGLHLVIKLLACVLKSATLTRFFFRHILAKTIIKNRTVTDRSERMLVMEHELFKHLEIEIFVPASQLRPAAAFVRAVIEMFAGAIAAPHADIAKALKQIAMDDEQRQWRGSFTFHYPITFRRVLPDDTLISMTAGAAEPWYAISFITYVEPRDRFYALASFLARAMTQFFHARLHWGKHFPLSGVDVERCYPHLPEFRALCRQVDPHGVFRNDFTDRVLFGVESTTD
jgi:FAD/FMN-containing dehydrogenase